MAHKQMREKKIKNKTKKKVEYFSYGENGLIPFWVSKKQNCEFNMDLLLLSDGQMHHYVLIRNSRSLIHKVKERVVRADNHICRNCFHVCTSKERYEKHLELCWKNKPAIVRMTKNTTYYYKKFQSRWFAPIVGFFDLESIIEPVSGCQNNPTQSETRTIEVHKPCSYAMLFVTQNQTEPFHFECLTGPKVMEKFV